MSEKTRQEIENIEKLLEVFIWLRLKIGELIRIVEKQRKNYLKSMNTGFCQQNVKSVKGY